MLGNKISFNHLNWIQVRESQLVTTSTIPSGCGSVSAYLIFAGILYYFCTQVAAFDGAQVLLVALPITGIFVEHVRGACLCLRLNDGIPKLLSFHNFADTTLLLVTERQNYSNIYTLGRIHENIKLRRFSKLYWRGQREWYSSFLKGWFYLFLNVCLCRCVRAHGNQSWTNVYFQDAWLVIWGLRSKAGPQDCMNTLNYRTIPPTLKFIFYLLRPPENQAALDSFKWPHQINSTYENKKEQEPLSKPWHCLHCLLFLQTLAWPGHAFPESLKLPTFLDPNFKRPSSLSSHPPELLLFSLTAS